MTRDASRPNVLLITLDTTRADRLGSYGYPLAHTPRLDQLARSGVRVVHAISAAPITATAHSTILTGLLPPTHGVRDNGSFRLPNEVQTLAEVLKGAGYATAAFVSAAVLDSRYNLNQGFDTYDDDLWSENTPEMFMIRERAGARTAQRAIAWLNAQHKQHPAQPFFVWVHLFDVHEPHKPAAADALLSGTLYDAEIAGVDRHVGALLDAAAALQPREQTLIAVTADHGESLGEHGESTHGIFVYQSTVSIPLLLSWPGRLPAGRVYKAPVHQVDLFPTILAATNTKAPANQGLDLLSALEGKAPPPQRLQYSESMMSELGFGMAPLVALRDATYTYVRAPRPELYDRAHDPGELHNLIEAQPAVAARLSGELDRLLAECAAHAFHAPEQVVDPQNAEMLRALGYVGDSATRKEVAAMDPKDGIAVYEKLHLARQQVRSARYQDAGVTLRALLALTPRNVSALNVLALSEERAGHHDQAKELYHQSLQIEANQGRVHLQLASILLDEQQLDQAVSEAQRALELSPALTEALVLLGILEQKRGDRAAADKYYQRALAADPGFPRALHAYADLFFREHDYAHALEYYRKALERVPHNFAGLIQAGASARRVGDGEAARQYYQRAAELRPDSWIPTYNLACLYAVQGDRDAALAQLTRAVADGISDPDLLQTDTDFESLRKDREFISLAAQARAGAPAQGDAASSAREDSALGQSAPPAAR